MGIWEKHAFTNQNLMEHRQSMIDGPQLEVQNIEASKLYFIFVFVMFRRLRFGFPICSVCACVHVLSRNQYLLGWPLKGHFLFKSTSICLRSVWGSGYVSLVHYYRRSITFQPCSFNVQSTVLSCSIYLLSTLQFCPTNSGHVPFMFCLCSSYVLSAVPSTLQLYFVEQGLAMFLLSSV